MLYITPRTLSITNQSKVVETKQNNGLEWHHSALHPPCRSEFVLRFLVTNSVLERFVWFKIHQREVLIIFKFKLRENYVQY